MRVAPHAHPRTPWGRRCQCVRRVASRWSPHRSTHARGLGPALQDSCWSPPQRMMLRRQQQQTVDCAPQTRACRGHRPACTARSRRDTRTPADSQATGAHFVVLHLGNAALDGRLASAPQLRIGHCVRVRVRARHREHRPAAALVRAAHVADPLAHVLVAVRLGRLRVAVDQLRELRQVHHHQRDGARREEHAVRARVHRLPPKVEHRHAQLRVRLQPGVPLLAQDLQQLRAALGLDALAGGEQEHEAGLAGLALAHHRQLHAVARLRAPLVQRAHVPRRGLRALGHHLARGRDQVVVAAEPQLLQVGQGADGRGDARQATVVEVERMDGAVGGHEGVDERRRAHVAQRGVVAHAQHLQAGQRAQRLLRQRARPARAHAVVRGRQRRRALVAQRVGAEVELCEGAAHAGRQHARPQRRANPPALGCPQLNRDRRTAIRIQGQRAQAVAVCQRVAQPPHRRLVTQRTVPDDDCLQRGALLA
eukprot:scaffold2044_cov202-Prasinococcus_capsulatus_cf.AAC.12